MARDNHRIETDKDGIEIENNQDIQSKPNID